LERLRQAYRMNSRFQRTRSINEDANDWMWFV
jgi:hypothetical protein